MKVGVELGHVPGEESPVDVDAGSRQWRPAGLGHMLADVGQDLLLRLGKGHSAGNLVQEARGRVHVDDDRVHALEDREVVGPDDDVDARIELGEVGVGHDDSDLDELVLGEVQAGHLAVDPHESILRGHGRRLPPGEAPGSAARIR